MKVMFGDTEGDDLLDGVTRIWCGVFRDKDTRELFQFRPHQMKEMCAFLDTVDVLIMHNGIAYDREALKKVLGYEFKGRMIDSLIVSRLLNPRRFVPPNCPKKNAPHSIEAWGYRVGIMKPEHEDWSKFSEEMLVRCTEDVNILEAAWKILGKEAEGKGYKNAFNLTFDLMYWLEKQRQYGWKVDRGYMMKCVETLDRWIGRIDRVLSDKLPLILEIESSKKEGGYIHVKPFKKNGELSAACINHFGKHYPDWNHSDIASIVSGPFSKVSFRHVSLDKPLELKNYLLSLGWEPLEWNTNDSGEQTSPKLSKDDPFEGISDRTGKLVAKRTSCKQRKGIIEGWIKAIRHDGRIPSEIGNLAITGRMTHKLIANVPRAGSFFGKQMRKMFTCSEGMVLVGADSDQNQLRMFAARIIDPDFTKALVFGKKEDGTDVHTFNQKLVGAKDRDTAKTFIYALLFGAGPAKISKVLGCSSSTAKSILQDYHNRLKGLEALLKKLKAEFRKTAKKRIGKYGNLEYYDGWITCLDGRKIKVPFEHQLLVYILQSDEAILMTKAFNLLNEILAEKYVWGIDYGVVTIYHDEYVIECRKEIAEDVKKISEQCIVDAGKFYEINCPHIGTGRIGRNWYEVH